MQARDTGDRRHGVRCARRALLFAALLLGIAARAEAQDLPGTVANLQTLPAGSLVIPMDLAHQALVAPFNIRAYGLVNDLLQNDIPVKWVIRAGKGKDGVDFSATARQVAPSAGAVALESFRAGPFVVHRAYAAAALARAAAFGGSVAVYELTADAVVDVRHELTFKPRAFVNTVNSSIATNLLDAAGIPDYAVQSDFTLVANSCFTLVMEPHNDTPDGVAAVRAFLEEGGNLLAQCASAHTYENDAANGHFITTGGTTRDNVKGTLVFATPDLPFSQFEGDLRSQPGGSHQDWSLPVGSVFTNGGHGQLENAGTSPMKYAAMAGKLYPGASGGMVFYLGGHDWAGGNLDQVNGQRMVLNALLTPPTRPLVCGLQVAVPDLTIQKTHPGDVTAGDTVTYTIAVTNAGTAATNDTIVVRDTLPAGFTFVSGTGSGWSVSESGGVVVATRSTPLVGGGSTTITLRAAIPTSLYGSFVNRAVVSGGGEVNTANDTAADPTTVLANFDLDVRPDVVDSVIRLRNAGGGYAFSVAVSHGSFQAEDVWVVAFTDATGAGMLTVDSITGASVVPTGSPDSVRLASIANGATDSVTVWYRVTGAPDSLYGMLWVRAHAAILPSAVDSTALAVRPGGPTIQTVKAAAPGGVQVPGTDVAYTITVSNVGTHDAVDVVTVDSLAAELELKVGTVTSTLPLGIVAVVEYSTDGADWTYVPVSGGCGAPAAFDRCVTRIRWTLQQPLPAVPPDSTAVLGFVARIR